MFSNNRFSRSFDIVWTMPLLLIAKVLYEVSNYFVHDFYLLANSAFEHQIPFIQNRFAIYIIYYLLQVLFFIFNAGLGAILIPNLCDVCLKHELLLKKKNLYANIKKFFKLFLVINIVRLILQKIISLLFKGALPLSTIYIYFIIEQLAVLYAIYKVVEFKTEDKYKIDFWKLFSSNATTVFLILNLVASLSVWTAWHQTNNFIFISTPFFLLGTLAHLLAIAYFYLSLSDSLDLAEKKEKILYLIAPLWASVASALANIILRTPPPFFMVLKALTPKDYRIEEFNAVLWRKRYERSDALVAISCFTSNSYRAYKIAKDLKAKGATVIMGGPHVTWNSDEALEFCDAVVIGEAEEAWPQLIKDYEAGTLKEKYYGQSIDEFYKEYHPLLLESDPRLTHAFIETTRGCKFNCDFCSIPNLSKKSIRHKPIDLVIEEIRHAAKHGQKFAFLDNNIFADPPYAKELFRRMIEEDLSIKWESCSSVDIARDDEALRLAKESGCYEFFIGFEIVPGSQEKSKGGKLALVGEYADLAKKIKDVGININAHFILGFDEDNFGTVVDTFKFCLKLLPTYAAQLLLTPLPGTVLFQKMVNEQRVLSLNWKRYDIRKLVLKPKNMSSYSMIILYEISHYLLLLVASRYVQVFFLAVIVAYYLMSLLI